MSPPSLSVVLPVYNEEANLAELHRRLESSLAELDSFELLYVNDASTGGSQKILEDLVATHPHVRVLVFSRNFGHQVALTAGLDHARGQAVVTMDSDLQDPPETCASQHLALVHRRLDRRLSLQLHILVRRMGTRSLAEARLRPLPAGEVTYPSSFSTQNLFALELLLVDELSKRLHLTVQLVLLAGQRPDVGEEDEPRDGVGGEEIDHDTSSSL